MNTFLVTFAVFALVMAIMAVGVLFGRPAIKGSCGGLNTLKGLESACPACSGSGHCEGDKASA